MEIRKYTYVDVYYSEKEIEQAKKERKRLKKLGYQLENEDAGAGKHEYCDQYIKYSKFIERE
jgi:hypothetical protein